MIEAQRPVARGALAAALLVLTACGSAGGGPADDWSRTYLSSYEEVFTAVLDSLEDIDFYLVETDEARGRVEAASSARRGGDVMLLVDVDDRGTSVRVEVMARDAAAQNDRAPTRMRAVVAELLRNLDARL